MRAFFYFAGLLLLCSCKNVGTDLTSSTIPDWWKSCDSKMARQLTNQGMTDAANTGKTLKLLAIPVGQLRRYNTGKRLD